MSKKDEIDLSGNLSKLSEIADWFEQQDEVDVEEGLKKVRGAAALIKESKGRLQEIENEFEEIKRDIEEEIGEEEGDTNDEGEEVNKKHDDTGDEEDGGNPDNIPF